MRLRPILATAGIVTCSVALLFAPLSSAATTPASGSSVTITDDAGDTTVPVQGMDLLQVKLGTTGTTDDAGHYTANKIVVSATLDAAPNDVPGLTAYVVLPTACGISYFEYSPQNAADGLVVDNSYISLCDAATSLTGSDTGFTINGATLSWIMPLAGSGLSGSATGIHAYTEIEDPTGSFGVNTFMEGSGFETEASTAAIDYASTDASWAIGS